MKLTERGEHDSPGRLHTHGCDCSTVPSSMIVNRRLFVMAALGTALYSEASLLPSAAQEAVEDSVLELRQYTLRGGQRETMIALFESTFVEPQNALGAHVLGTFRDLDDPDRFVWVRGFREMDARQRALEAFYNHPVWLTHRQAANATMLDSDNVLLLRPAAPGQGVAIASRPHTSVGRVIGATIHYLANVDPFEFSRFFDQAVAPHLATAGVHPIARLVTEEAANNFPRLPIREHDRTFIWLARWESLAAEEAVAARFARLSGWRDSAPESVLPALMRKPERLRLAPTRRSVLR